MSSKVAAFDQLLSLVKEERLRPSTYGQRGVLISSESDKGRVINSAPFRRLQQKAQVFPLEPNAAVRTRLTHSIEVSQVGRHLAQKVIELKGDINGGEYATLAAFVNTVETACLLHDIGNPPFGHLGEAAIRHWFEKRSNSPPDMLHFDGNPQGFRIAAFLAGADAHGLNLTCTQLLSIVKYPTRAAAGCEGKAGIFDSEWESYEKACAALNWPVGKKFPFAQLMDSADDIAYSTSDLEDALEKDIVSIEELKQAFGSDRFSSNAVEAFVAFKTKFINEAARQAAETFVRELDSILSGQNVELLDPNSEIGALLKDIKAFARKRIYTDKAAEQVELAGNSAIAGLLDKLGILLEMPEEDFASLLAGGDDARAKSQDFHLRLVHRVPLGYRNKYSMRSDSEPNRRAHMVTDFISGMTDDFALETYQVLHGIKTW